MKKIEVNFDSTTGKISRKNLIQNEELYNNPDKYVRYKNTDNIDSTSFANILYELPEFVGGKEIIVTNTGLLVFENGGHYYAYDITDYDEEDISLSNISPDFTSTKKNYTSFNNPLGVRRIRVSKDDNGNMFLCGDVYYTYDSNGEKRYVFEMDVDIFELNADIKNRMALDINIVAPNEDGYFDYTKYKTNTAVFNYNQSRIVTFYNCTGTVNDIELNFKLNNSSEGDDSVYLDFSNDALFKRTDLNSDNLVLLNSNFLTFDFNDVKENAYIEVR